MQKRSDRWDKKAKRASKPKVTAADVAAAKDAADAAEKAHDAERGAAAVSGMAAKDVQKGKAQADAIWEKFKQRHPESSKATTADSSSDDDKDEDASKHVTDSEEAETDKAAKEYHATVSSKLEKA